MKWSEIVFVPDEQAIREMAAAWRWLIPEPWVVIFSSMFGGVFLEKETGGAFWLECGTGVIERVAETAAELHSFLSGTRDEVWSNRLEEWFLPPLVERLYEAGKIPASGQCYGFTILPIFKGGTYSVENAFVLSAREWLVWTGEAHERVRDLPDGAQVQVKIVP